MYTTREPSSTFFPSLRLSLSLYVLAVLFVAVVDVIFCQRGVRESCSCELNESTDFDVLSFFDTPNSSHPPNSAKNLSPS